MKLSVFNLGDTGINLTRSPVHSEDGEWVLLQNAALELRGADHGIAKRPGIQPFAGGLSGTVFALINVGVVSTPPPTEGPDGPVVGITTVASLQVMRCKLYLTAATTAIDDDTQTVIDWTAEAWDVGNLHDLVTNPSRITIPNDGDGLYLLIAQAEWATEGNVVKKRALRLLKNASEVAQAAVGADDDGDVLCHQVSALVPAVAGDYFTVSVEQETGGSSDLVGNSEYTTWVTVLRIVATAEWQLARCHAVLDANVTLTKDTPLAIGFPAEAVDTHAMHDLAANNSRITVVDGQAGLYFICGQYARQNVAQGYVVVELLKNGTQVLATSNQNFINASTDPDAAGQVVGAFEMAVGDYVEMRMTYRNYAAVPAATTVILGSADSAVQLGRTTLFAARIG